jgi:hypothetical protein
MTLAENPHPGHHRFSEETWACARADFTAGDSARAVCERYGIPLSTFWERARAEGWRRGDLPDPEPLADLDPEALEDLAEVRAPELRRTAWARTAAAVARGRDKEARSWMRLYQQLGDYCAVGELRGAEQAAEAASTSKILYSLHQTNRRLRAILGEAGPDSPDSSDSVFSESTPAPAPNPAQGHDPPPNRAARRRAAALKRARRPGSAAPG